MKLYEVPRNTKIKTENGTLLNFHHIDGMYSYCTNADGEVVHLVAWTDVEVVDNKDE